MQKNYQFDRKHTGSKELTHGLDVCIGHAYWIFGGCKDRMPEFLMFGESRHSAWVFWVNIEETAGRQKM
jgi:hypothetical protein